MTKGRWITEDLHETIGFRTQFSAHTILHDDHTGRQHLVVFDTPHFGRVLMLDGAVQLTTSDEFIYHEMMVHVPLFALAAAGRGAREVLIVGGGDGGTAREVLRHHSVRKVVQVEIDRGVVDVCLKYLPQVSAGAFDDARLELIIGDGADYVKSRRAAFDVVIVDATDPVGPGTALFTAEFYADCAGALRPGGVLVTQNGVPFLQPEELGSTMTAFTAIFAAPSAYMATIPSYVGGPMAFGWGSDAPLLAVPSSTDLGMCFDQAGFRTRYYSPKVHLGAFALPPYVSDIIASTTAMILNRP